MKWVKQVSVYPGNIYLFKVNKRNNWKKWNMFKVNNEDTRMTSFILLTLIVSLLLTLNIFHLFPGVSIVDFEQVFV